MRLILRFFLQEPVFSWFFDYSYSLVIRCRSLFDPRSHSSQSRILSYGRHCAWIAGKYAFRFARRRRRRLHSFFSQYFQCSAFRPASAAGRQGSGTKAEHHLSSRYHNGHVSSSLFNRRNNYRNGLHHPSRPLVSDSGRHSCRISRKLFARCYCYEHSSCIFRQLTIGCHITISFHCFHCGNDPGVDDHRNGHGDRFFLRCSHSHSVNLPQCLLPAEYLIGAASLQHLLGSGQHHERCACSPQKTRQFERIFV